LDVFICDWLGAGPGTVVGDEAPVAPATDAEKLISPTIARTRAPRANEAQRARHRVFRQSTDGTLKG